MNMGLKHSKQKAGQLESVANKKQYAIFSGILINLVKM